MASTERGDGGHGRKVRRCAAVPLALLLLTLTFPHATATPAGEDFWHLDDTFGTGGEVTTKFGSGFDEVFDVTTTKDNKILAVGDAFMSNNDFDFAMARYNEDGSLDPTFGTSGDGKVTTDFGSSTDDRARGVAITSDGRIVVVGSSDHAGTGRPRVAVAVYSSNGTELDHHRYDEFPISQALAVAAYPSTSPNSGKIVLVGNNRDVSNIGQFLVARLDVAGDGTTSLDPTFGSFGSVMPSLQTSGHSSANAVAIRSDDKILVAGTVDQQEFSLIGNRIGLLRLNANGTMDDPFGSVGIGWAADDCAPCAAWGMGIRADGSILVAGQVRSNTAGFDMFGWRFSSSGKLKARLSTDFFGHDDVARDVVFQSGKMVLVGWTSETGDGSSLNDLVHFAFARFNNVPESVDTTFGPDGKVTAAFAFGYDAALAGVVTSDGEIVAAGGSNQAPPGTADLDFALARLTGPNTHSPGFKAEVYHLKPFTLKAAPDKFRVFWREEGAPGAEVKFSVRSREARWDETKFGGWQPVVNKTKARSMMLKASAGRTVCFSVRAHSDGLTTDWSEPKCTGIPVDDRTLDKQPNSAWGSYKRSDCYRNTYAGNGGGTGAVLHLEAAFKHLGVLVAKGPGFGKIEVRVNDTAVKRISLQASSIKCGVLVDVKQYDSAPRRDVDIVVIRQGDPGSFVDGLAVSLVKN